MVDMEPETKTILSTYRYIPYDIPAFVSPKVHRRPRNGTIHTIFAICMKCQVYLGKHIERSTQERQAEKVPTGNMTQFFRKKFNRLQQALCQDMKRHIHSFQHAGLLRLFLQVCLIWLGNPGAYQSPWDIAKQIPWMYGITLQLDLEFLTPSAVTMQCTFHCAQCK